MGTTAIQVYYGLAGMIIDEDENSKELNLPDDYGISDIPLIIQDRNFNKDGSFDYLDNMMDGAVGNHLLVNGAITPDNELVMTFIVDEATDDLTEMMGQLEVK